MEGHLRAIDDPATGRIFRRKQTASVVKRLFSQQATLIRQGWLRRRASFARLQPNESILVEDPDDWLLRHTYRLVKHLLVAGHQEILQALVEEVGTRHGSRHDIGEQPFKQALLAMFWWHEGATSAPVLTRQRRSEWGDAMEYARRHNVPSKYFCAFARQCRLKNIGYKLQAGHREPGFKLNEARPDSPQQPPTMPSNS